MTHGQGGRSSLLMVGAGILVTLTVVAVLAPLLSPYDPRALSGDSLERPSSRHLLGTNDVGQDIFSEIVWGARSSLQVAVGAAALAVALGVLIGAGAGLRGGLADVVAMRLVDVFLAVPLLPLIIVVATLAGPGHLKVILIMGVLAWPGIARTVRSQTLSLRSRGFIEAARGFGGGLGYVMRRHLVPALAPMVVAEFVAVASIAVGLEAGLAFLGVGDPLAVSWGQVLNRALLHPGLYFTALWTWWLVPAGLAITVAVLGFTFLGVGLEPRFNPRWRRGL